VAPGVEVSVRESVFLDPTACGRGGYSAVITSWGGAPVGNGG
jgi:hypothetical protein